MSVSLWAILSKRRNLSDSRVLVGWGLSNLNTYFLSPGNLSTNPSSGCWSEI